MSQSHGSCHKAMGHVTRPWVMPQGHIYVCFCAWGSVRVAHRVLKVCKSWKFEGTFLGQKKIWKNKLGLSWSRKKYGLFQNQRNTFWKKKSNTDVGNGSEEVRNYASVSIEQTAFWNYVHAFKCLWNECVCCQSLCMNLNTVVRRCYRLSIVFILAWIFLVLIWSGKCLEKVCNFVTDSLRVPCSDPLWLTGLKAPTN